MGDIFLGYEEKKSFCRAKKIEVTQEVPQPSQIGMPFLLPRSQQLPQPSQIGMPFVLPHATATATQSN